MADVNCGEQGDKKGPEGKIDGGAMLRATILDQHLETPVQLAQSSGRNEGGEVRCSLGLPGSGQKRS